jgi:hypothetical protein
LAFAVLAGTALGVALGWSVIRFTGAIIREAEEVNPVRLPREASMVATEPSREPVSGVIENEAWHYAQAVQQGDWDGVMRRVPWMLERLSHAELNEGGAAARAAAQRELVALMEDRSPSSVENQLLAEGVEDWFVFSPHAVLAAEFVDAGRHDLESPAASRTWIRVIYESPATALRDGFNLPIRSLLAGVNVSESGAILKANVIGNLDIDEESVRYFAASGPGAGAEGGNDDES